MLIDVNLDKHISEINDELNDFDYVELKNKLKSLLGLNVILSKDKLKRITLIMRVCMDYMFDNKDKIKNKDYHVERTMEYINKTLVCGNLTSFRVVYDLETDTFGYKVIIELEDEVDEYCINQKVKLEELEYLCVSDIADMLHLIKNED